MPPQRPLIPPVSAVVTISANDRDIFQLFIAKPLIGQMMDV
jgi:hypothetical protein